VQEPEGVNSSVAEVFVTPKLFDRIVASEQNLIAIETANPAEVLAQFRMLALRTGQSVYYWQDETGISSLRDREARVPGSKRSGDALRYILQSPQFGVYIFTEYAENLRPPNINVLRQLARTRATNSRKVVFVGAKFRMPEGMESMFEHIAHEQVTRVRPRLRDGRWVA
jgi:hypothetical protein